MATRLRTPNERARHGAFSASWRRAGKERLPMRTNHLTPFDHPVNLLSRFTRDMERFFDAFGLARPVGEKPLLEQTQWIPDVDIVEKDGILAIRADLPGMTRKDVSVEITDNTLSIKGERKTDVEEKHDGILRQERTYGSFVRTFPLPETVKAEEVQATFINGVLEVKVVLPAEKMMKPRRIEVLEPAPEKETAKTAA
jgi:HSP20 family protein